MIFSNRLLMLRTGMMYYNPVDNKIYVYDGGWLSTAALT